MSTKAIRYDPAFSPFSKEISPTVQTPSAVAVYDRNDRDLQTVAFKGTICSDEFYLQLREHARLTKITSNFLSISDVQATKYEGSFESAYSGFVGF